jgi:predicted phage-related endonuclease
MDLTKYLTTCKVFSTVSQQEDEAGWLAARSRGIGGSDIGPICGVSVFTTARRSI